MIAVDTTILVYAVGADHPLREPCRQVITAIRGRVIRAVTTAEVIQEFAHVRARRRGREDASALARSYATLLSPLLQPDEADLRAGLELFAATQELGAFDAVLAATALRDDHVDALMSADRAFAQVPGPTYLDPADPDVARGRTGLTDPS